MKRTIFFFTILITTLIFIFTFTNTGLTSNSDTCCQKFQIVTAGGVLSGCLITIDPFPGPVLSCTPDANLQCKICGLTTGVTYTAVATCDGKRTGSTNFTACGSIVTIVVSP